MRRRPLLAGVGTAIAASLAGCFDAVFTTTVTESFQNSYEAPDGAVLAVRNVNGTVTVRSTDADQVTVSGEKRAGSEEGLDTIAVDVTEAEQFVVEASFEPAANIETRRVDLTVEVPDGVTVDRARTENGGVTVEGVRGDVRARTRNGDVEVTDVDGYVRCETSNGDVRARGTTGLAGARTDNGTVDVELLGIRSDVTCRSSNGSVTVRVGPDVSCGFRLSTTNGRAEVRDLPHDTSMSRRRRVRGRIRGGGPTLRAESTNGNVTLRSADS